MVDPHQDTIGYLFEQRELKRAAARQAEAERIGATTAPGATSAGSTPVGRLTEKRRAAWLDSMLRHGCDRVANAPQGSRNDELNRVAYTLGGIVHHGLDERTARDALRVAALGVGLDVGETDRTLDSGFGAGATHPLDVELAERDLMNGAIAPPDVDGSLLAFWSERPLLRHLYDYARARRASPWAVLGVELVRASTAIEPTVALPPLVGGYASLNLFVALVGVSGAGKGGAERTASEALTMPHVKRATLGSGEGIAHSYRKRKRDGTIERLTNRMLFSVPEVDTLAAVGGRQGATLLPELRRAWSGEQLGFAYADASKHLPVEAHSYRLGLVLGVQPARAHTLLNDVDGGTPQRFVWLPAHDRAAPDETPPAPTPWSWEPPGFDASRVTPFTMGLAPMGVCEQARKVIDEAALARLRDQVAALDGHLLLAQLKVAAALAVLDGRLDVDDDDWRLADTVMSMSMRTRERVAEALTTGSRDRNRARAMGEADRALIVDEKLAEAAAGRASRRILTVLGQRGTESRAPLRKAVAGRDRATFDEAVQALLTTGQITRTTDEKGTERYGLPRV